MSEASPFDRHDFLRRRQILKVGNHAVKFTVTPSVCPEYVVPRTVFLVPGFMSGLSNMALLAHHLSLYGNQVVSMSYETPKDDNSEYVRRMLAAYLDGETRATVFDQLVLVGHSKAGIDITRAIHKDLLLQQTVSAMIHLAPAGYGGVHPEDAIRSIVTEMAYRPASADVRDMARDALSYIIGSGHRLIDQARYVQDTNITEEIEDLREAGIETRALTARYDYLIHHDALSTGLARAGVSQMVIPEVKAGHNFHLFFPELTAQIIEADMNDMMYCHSEAVS